MNRTPLLFFGHGSPMHALGGYFADQWRAIGVALEKPRAVLMISAHWYVNESAVTAMERPRTIHDFGGFPQPLFEVQYAAPGAPWLAARVQELSTPTHVRADHDWGFDHGTWAVLRHVFPDTDVPIVQLAMDARAAPRAHYELGRTLAPLRDEGVMICGSGNVVHNLRTMRRDMAERGFEWASQFSARVRDAVLSGDDESLVEYSALGPDARLAIPTPEHYLPLLYVLGARAPGERAEAFTDVMDLGSISMLSFRTN